MPGTCRVPVSSQSQARPPPGYNLKSLPMPSPSTSILPHEIWIISGERICDRVIILSLISGELGYSGFGAKTSEHLIQALVPCRITGSFNLCAGSKQQLYDSKVVSFWLVESRPDSLTKNRAAVHILY